MLTANYTTLLVETGVQIVLLTDSCPLTRGDQVLEWSTKNGSGSGVQGSGGSLKVLKIKSVFIRHLKVLKNE